MKRYLISITILLVGFGAGWFLRDFNQGRVVQVYELKQPMTVSDTFVIPEGTWLVYDEPDSKKGDWYHIDLRIEGKSLEPKQTYADWHKNPVVVFSE